MPLTPRLLFPIAAHACMGTEGSIVSKISTSVRARHVSTGANVRSWLGRTHALVGQASVDTTVSKMSTSAVRSPVSTGVSAAKPTTRHSMAASASALGGL